MGVIKAASGGLGWLDVISGWLNLMCPFKDWEDGEGYTLDESLIDCSLLGFVDLLGHIGGLFGLVGLIASHGQRIAHLYGPSTII